jgi:hypothetical protein
LSSFSNSFCSFLPEIRLRPVFFEHFLYPLDHLRVARDQSNLAARIQLERPEALTADKHGVTVTDHRADMQPPRSTSARGCPWHASQPSR